MRRPAPMLLIAALATAGPPDGKAGPPTLPPLNARVEAFARSNLGKPVGDGICITLAVEALRSAGAKAFPFDPGGDFIWGEPVDDYKDVLPGDILQFRDAVFRGTRTIGRNRRERWHHDYPHHTAIVARVDQGGKLIAIYQQNVSLQGRDEAEKGNVREAVLRMDSLQKGGRVKAYRPVAPDPPRGPMPGDDGPGR